MVKGEAESDEECGINFFIARFTDYASRKIQRVSRNKKMRTTTGVLYWQEGNA